MSPSKKAVQRSWRVFTHEQKATGLRRHLGAKVPVSAMCDEYQIAPSLLYLWHKQALEHLATGLQNGRTARASRRSKRRLRRRIAS